MSGRLITDTYLRIVKLFHFPVLDFFFLPQASKPPFMRYRIEARTSLSLSLGKKQEPISIDQNFQRATWKQQTREGDKIRKKEEKGAMEIVGDKRV